MRLAARTGRERRSGYRGLMDEKQKNEKRKYDNYGLWAAGLAIGIAIGIGYGVNMHNVGVGIGIGVGIGLVFGLAFQSKPHHKR